MPDSMFRCPYTGMNVQRPFAVDPAADPSAYLTVKCPACARLHFINRSTDKLLGRDA